MKVAAAIAEFLRDQGIGHVFCISGGASLHIIHGIADTDGIDYICPQHEQAAGFAADAYARIKGIGCALSTSGPGIPVLYLTGQVVTFRMTGTSGVRQMGFQETPIVDMVKPITKYAVMPVTKEDVLPELRKAVRIAKEGRPGPVLVDVPDDIQRMALQ